jgi:hypothetical protein
VFFAIPYFGAQRLLHESARALVFPGRVLSGQRSRAFAEAIECHRAAELARFQSEDLIKT